MGVSIAIFNPKPATGSTPFIADGILDFVDLSHNTNQFEPKFTLTTLNPISANHLNRTISYPNNNTIRITFTNPPILGENATYIWTVPRNQ